MIQKPKPTSTTDMAVIFNTALCSASSAKKLGLPLIKQWPEDRRSTTSENMLKHFIYAHVYLISKSRTSSFHIDAFSRSQLEAPNTTSVLSLLWPLEQIGKCVVKQWIGFFPWGDEFISPLHAYCLSRIYIYDLKWPEADFCSLEQTLQNPNMTMLKSTTAFIPVKLSSLHKVIWVLK